MEKEYKEPVNPAEIFNQRIIDLEQYRDINPASIRDYEERSIVIISKANYDLNVRLAKLFKGSLS